MRDSIKKDSAATLTHQFTLGSPPVLKSLTFVIGTGTGVTSFFIFKARNKKIPHTLQYEGFYKKGFGGDLDPPVHPRQSTRAEEFNFLDQNRNGCNLWLFIQRLA